MADLTGKKQEVTIRDFLNVVFRWKFLILAVVLVTSFLIVYLKASKPVAYVSSSRLLVKRGERENVFVPNPRYLSWAEEMSSELEVILSEAVFSRARKVFADSLENRGLEGTRRFSSGAVRADVVGESNVIVVSYSGLDPLECELGCKAVTYAYMDYFKEKTAPPTVTDFFESEIDEALHDLTTWRTRKSEFLSREGFLGSDRESSHQLYKLSRLQMALADEAGDLQSQRLRVEYLSELLDLSGAELDRKLTTTASDDPVQSRVFSDLRFELLKLKSKREEILTLYTEKHPDVIAVDNQINDLRIQIKQEIRNAYDIAAAEYEELLAKYNATSAEVEKTQVQIDAIPEKERQLSRIESKITAFEEKYQLLLEKQHEAEIAEASSSDFEIVVLTPPGKAWQRRTSDYVRLSVGPFLALIVGLGLAFFFESMDHSLKNPAEVEEYLGSTVLATIGEMKSKK
ncbi:MAG: hypothetical protein JSW50_15670 [Candidatus Latescibacterota bacterium]|nr:MAG: hypothetical protein JSW50_15670 [Candidatus Latescibacterota bacterium]